MIPVPDHLAHLPTWHGLPIPNIAAWEGDYPETAGWTWRHDPHVQRMAWFPPDDTQGVGKPVLGRMHPGRQRRSAMTLRCQVCDTQLETGQGWLVIAPNATLQTVTVEGREGKALVVHEPWLCPLCVRYSIQVCPGLVGRRRVDQLMLHRPRTYLNIMSTAYMDGPRAEEAKRVLPALWVKIAVSDGLTLDPDEYLASEAL